MIFRTLFRQSSSSSKEQSTWKIVRSKAKAAESIGNYPEAARLYRECLSQMEAAYLSGNSSMSERYYSFKSSELRFAIAKLERMTEDRLQKK
jgi:hypothetical protein